jgi:hypothetical protein
MAWIAVDSAGNLYVTDYTGVSIRKVTPTGVVTTVIGINGPVIFGQLLTRGFRVVLRGIVLHSSSMYVTTDHCILAITNFP